MRLLKRLVCVCMAQQAIHWCWGFQRGYGDSFAWTVYWKINRLDHCFSETGAPFCEVRCLPHRRRCCAGICYQGFSLAIDSADVAKMYMNVRYFDGKEFREVLLFLISLEGPTTGDIVFTELEIFQAAFIVIWDDWPNCDRRGSCYGGKAPRSGVQIEGPCPPNAWTAWLHPSVFFEPGSMVS